MQTMTESLYCFRILYAIKRGNSQISVNNRKYIKYHAMGYLYHIPLNVL